MNSKKSNYRNTPIKPGIYWAKTDSSCEQYNLIVEIYGEVPYLRWNTWNKNTNRTQTGNAEPDFVFGNEIIEPDAIVKLDQTLVDNFNTAASGLKNEIEKEAFEALKENYKKTKNDNILLKNKLTFLRDRIIDGKYDKIDIIRELSAIINESVT